MFPRSKSILSGSSKSTTAAPGTLQQRRCAATSRHILERPAMVRPRLGVRGFYSSGSGIWSSKCDLRHVVRGRGWLSATMPGRLCYSAAYGWKLVLPEFESESGSIAESTSHAWGKACFSAVTQGQQGLKKSASSIWFHLTANSNFLNLFSIIFFNFSVVKLSSSNFVCVEVNHGYRSKNCRRRVVIKKMAERKTMRVGLAVVAIRECQKPRRLQAMLKKEERRV